MTKKILITGGTVFLSKAVADYFIRRGYDVYVLNRNTKPQVSGATLIKADRRNLSGELRYHHFDAILDITAYYESDITSLLNAVGGFDDFIMISTGSVYAGNARMPFTENSPVGPNANFGEYGTDKLAAENALLRRVPNAYILRPTYIYGAGNQLYREAFVFDCALLDRPFYLPGEGEMKLQFIHTYDICKFMELILTKRPAQHIFNMANREYITVREWVETIYSVAGKQISLLGVPDHVPQWKYFCFTDYEITMDSSLMSKYMPKTISMTDGLSNFFEWYKNNRNAVTRYNYLEYIDANFEI